jgi:hypothetical protein
MLTFDDPVDVNVQENEQEEAAVFTELPKCRALIIPMWMIEKLHVDFTTVPEQLVIQLKKGERSEERDEDS